MVSELEEIKKIRKKLGLTQNELAKKANVSQSLVAKIEAGLLDPGYTKTKQIFDALEELSQNEELEALDIMNKKLIIAKANEKITEVIKDMKKYSISQIPVVENDKPVGLITETILLDAVSSGKDIMGITVKQVMEDCPPIITPATRLSVVANLLHHFPIVIVAEKGNMLGLISKADLIEKIV